MNNKYIKSAVTQIVIRGGIELPEYNDRKFLDIIQGALYDRRKAIKELYLAMYEQSLSWALHEKCLSVCQEYNIYPNGYRFYKGKPERPTTLIEGLQYLTASDIKPLLKTRKLKVSGKKDDLIQRLNESASFDELSDICFEKYQEKQTDFERKTIFHSYELLVNMILARAYFLNEKDRLIDIFKNKHLKNRFVLKGVTLPNNEQAKKEEIQMAKLIDGTGYDDAIVNNKLCKLLPIYPSGASTIETEILSKKR